MLFIKISKIRSVENYHLPFLLVPKQDDGFDCCAFVMAYDGEVPDGKSPIDARFDVPAMRNHLI